MRVLVKVVSLWRLSMRMQCVFHHSLEKRKNAVLPRARPRQMWPGRSEISIAYTMPAPCGDRTHDHTLTKRMLYQLS